MIPRKDGLICFCIDFQRLNKNTKIPVYPLTNPASCFEKLHGAYYFTTLDLQSAHWSVPMYKNDKEKTAFTVRSAMYEFNMMPFGLTNTVATVCALMGKLFQQCQGEFIFCFMNDILLNIYSEGL